jgi:2-methylcitrate dehydratase PrpD
LAQKVDVQLDPELDKIHLSREDLRPSVVQIYLRDGKVFTERKDVAKGWPVNPLSEEEFNEKFKQLTQTCLSNHRTTRIFKLIRGIEELCDIRDFTKELVHF